MKNTKNGQPGSLRSGDLFGELEYIAASPAQEHGGFHPRVVAAAQAAMLALTDLQERAKTWQATADAHLDTLKTQREAMGELYAMAIEHCKYRGFSKHPTIDKAHALLWPNIASQTAATNHPNLKT
jgi:hypothetical protein